MTDWRKRILDRLAEQEMTVNQLAIAIDFSQSTLSRALKGTGELKSGRMSQIAEILGTTVDWIMYGAEPTGGASPPLFDQPQPLLAWLDGRTDTIEQRLNAPIPERAVRPFYWRQWLGDLSPDIPPGSILCVSQERPLLSGRIVMAAMGGEVFCRVARLCADGSALCSLHGGLPEIPLDDDIEIIGTVVWMCRDL